MFQKDKPKSGRLKKLVAVFLIFLSAIIIVLANYKIETFGNIGIPDLLYYLFNGSDGANAGTFVDPMVDNLRPFLIIFCVLLIPFVNLLGHKIIISIDFKTKKKNYNVIINPIKQKYLVIYSIFVLIISLSYGLNCIDTYGYIIARSSSSSFIKDNYVDPSGVKIVFPEQKRNLIFIYLESTEGTLFSTQNGGGMTESLIPELETIALNNTSFSNSASLGGALSAYSASWTVSGMVAQSSGIPIITTPSVGGNDLGNFGAFLPGAYSLGEVLEKEGYYQEIMFGSEASFGGRDKYYTQHGNYKIFDYYTAIQQEKIPDDYHVWWGYEDNKLIEYAKDELLTIAKSPTPFNFQLLTADTHFVDGYLDPACDTKFDTKYENTFACSSKRISEFADWIKLQDFYDNTTIIISGDHLGMQTDFYNERMSVGYQRTIYNAFINSAQAPVKEKQRQFLPFDMYPTTLASIGAEIEGESLGLGVNLFSTKQTLAEKLGVDYINAELQKNSNFYQDNILTKK